MQTEVSMQKIPLYVILLLLAICLVVGISIARIDSRVRSQEETPHSYTVQDTPPPDYLYYVLKDPRGFMLARAPEGYAHQPLSTPQPIKLIGSGFGLSVADAVLSIQLSPDGHYLAIDGTRPDAEQVWVYNTQHMTITLLPSYAQGNFLHWLPGGNGHTFLYRPMFPTGSISPADKQTWHATAWQIDAATGTHKGIDLGVPAANLVDAAPSPDGSRIVYSTSAGLSLGSDTWLASSNGGVRKHLFKNTGLEAINALFAWSPDSKNIVYERLVDGATPFLNAGLWLMDAQGGQTQRLADTDGGHGYAPAWSPDSRKVAFIVRTNPHDVQANIRAQALQSAINVIDITSKKIEQVASARMTGMQLNINPTWATNSTRITFTALNAPNHILGGTLSYWSVPATFSAVHPSVALLTAPIAHVVATS